MATYLVTEQPNKNLRTRSQGLNFLSKIKKKKNSRGANRRFNVLTFVHCTVNITNNPDSASNNGDLLQQIQGMAKVTITDLCSGYV